LDDVSTRDASTTPEPMDSQLCAAAPPAHVPYEPEGPREGLNAWLFSALASFSPRLVTYALQTAMMSRRENEYLRKLGVSSSHRAQVSSAIWTQALVGLTWVAAVGTGLNAFDLPGFRPAVFPPALGIALIFAALVVTLISSTPRVRLLASAARCTRLLCVLAPRTELKGMDSAFARCLDDPIFRRRRVGAVAWALTRDTARLAGQPVSAGATVGELLLWFGENPADHRRRPIVGAYLGELVIAVAGRMPIPHAQFAPAARLRTRSPREKARRQLRTAATNALVTGVFLAFVAALLRVLIK
jgi:hypothetical protein